MLPFVRTCLLWTLPGGLLCLLIWWGLLAIDPSRDHLGFARLQSSTFHSLVVGTSRSAQGVDPERMASLVPSTGTWLNFSFNVKDSPWCATYQELILEKLSCGWQPTEASTLLVFVDPWSLDSVAGKGDDSFLGQPWVNACGTPAWDYVPRMSSPLDVVSGSSGADFLLTFFSILPRRAWEAMQGIAPPPTGVQPSGWFPNPAVLTEEAREAAIRNKVMEYEAKAVGAPLPGKDNLRALEGTLESVQHNHPQLRILLIRPAVASAMYDLENRLFAGFDARMLSIAQRMGVTYCDVNAAWPDRSDAFFNDAHHMSIAGAQAHSSFLGSLLLSQ